MGIMYAQPERWPSEYGSGIFGRFLLLVDMKERSQCVSRRVCRDQRAGIPMNKPRVIKKKGARHPCRCPQRKSQPVISDLLVVRGLFVQRKIDMMVRLGDRADAANDCLPVLAFIIAVKDIAVGRAGE